MQSVKFKLVLIAAFVWFSGQVRLTAQDDNYVAGRADVNVGIGLIFPQLDDFYTVKIPMLQVTGIMR